ncbi:MAG TPA: hypothetical protein VGO60_08280, partial [Iamia sp.]|nr:hypothetical protein [Iamia sp.]
MPTTAEVEARLRRTAEACEPLVDELMRDDHPLAPAPPGARPTRSGRVGWLVAAGLVVAGVGAGVLVVNADDGPSDEVRATTPDTLFDRTTTTAPAAGHPAIATPLTLADGTEAVLSIPGPERWTARFAEVDVDLPQVEGGPLTVSLGAYADDPTVEERISERAYIGTWGSGRSLFVEIDGWTASLPLAGVDGILPDALVAEVAETLTFRVGPNGPTDISGAGLTVVEARAALTRERDVNGMEATLTVAHDPDGRHPTCVGHPPVSGLSRTQRCVADDQLLLTAR